MAISFSIDSDPNQFCGKLYNFGPAGLHPMEFTNAFDELRGSRETAWLGTALSLSSTVYDVSGPDAIKLLNYVCVNKDFSMQKIGRVRHGLLCNYKGQLLADGLVVRMSEDRFRTYYLAPVLQYYVEHLGMDVSGQWITDEFFLQLDGPRSLEILEAAAQTNLHAMKFAGRMDAVISGKPVTIIRLGMSGALAYELHGNEKDCDAVYTRILEVGQPFGVKRLGGEQYCENHTPGGYPNQSIHFPFPFLTSGEDMKKFLQNTGFFVTADKEHYDFHGSAADDPENLFVTPYDIKWDYIINYDHDFVGKEALLEIAKNPPRTAVTLEWNLEDVGAAYAAQIRNTNYIIYDDISQKCFNAGSTSKVLADKKMIGITSGRVRDYYHASMISLAFIRKEYANEGNELQILWGTESQNQRVIRAKVARFPYYNGEYRNETCDVDKMIPKKY